MVENANIGTSSFVWLIIGALIFIIVPVVIAIIWKIKKKEPFTTILIGAATFLLFALILEKPIQNVLLFPTTMGLEDNSISLFFAENPILLSIMVALFAGVFEETGRFVAFKTVLRKRTNKETSISYGIGHGGFEVMLILGITYLQYILYAVMINNGSFQTIIDQVAAISPEQLNSITAVVDMLSEFSFADVAVAVVERVFAVMYHVGASILVFYACRNNGKMWLYPLAILIHTVIDFIGALSNFNVIYLPTWALEGIVAVCGLLTFLGAYLFLYRKKE